MSPSSSLLIPLEKRSDSLVPITPESGPDAAIRSDNGKVVRSTLACQFIKTEKDFTFIKFRIDYDEAGVQTVHILSKEVDIY